MPKFFATNKQLAATTLTLVSGGLLMLTGCGLGAPSAASDNASLALAGAVHGGQQPVSGSHIALFATASGGYGAALTPLATTTTDAGGNFRITAAYTCPAGQQAYLVSTGGNPGLTGTVDNSAIFLVAALGPCANVNNSTFVIINEATTVAAAYALSGFAPVGGANMTEAAITGGTASGFSTSSTNLQGLTDGFSNAINIIAPGVGQVNSVTAGGNGTIPAATVNSLADILQDCVNSSGPASTTCASLFTNATPPAGSGVAAPVNVFQAALDIAQYPGNNVGGLFSLISAQAAFGPTVTAAPNDWTIGITYTSSQIATPLGMTIDANDNVYVLGSTTADLAEFSPQGAALSPAPVGSAQGGFAPTYTTTAHNWRNATLDTSGNLFLSDGNTAGVYEYTPAGTATAPTPGAVTALSYSAVNTDANNYTIVADGLGDIYTTSYKKSTCAATTKACQLVEFVKGASTAYTPANTFSGATVNSPGVGGARGLAFDVTTGNFWQTDTVENQVTLTKFTPSATAAAAIASGPTPLTVGTAAGSPATNNYGSVAVSIDKSSNAWVVVQGGPAVTTGTTTTAAVSPGLFPITSAGAVGAQVSNALATSAANGGLSTPAYLAIDGNNNLFVANTLSYPVAGSSPVTFTTPSAVVEYSPGFNTSAGSFLSPNVGFSPGATYTNGVLSGSPLYAAAYVAVDRSGALWVLSGGTGTAPSLANLVQILGVAAPVNPVLANGKYGVKP